MEILMSTQGTTLLYNIIESEIILCVPLNFGKNSRLGYTWCIVWQYYTKAWYSIGIVNFSKASYTIPKLYQYFRHRYRRTFVTERG